MRYILLPLFLLLVAGCQKEIELPEQEKEVEKTVKSCSYKIVSKFRYMMAGGETLGALQLGGTADAGWYQFETSTYYVMVHDTIWNRYEIGQSLPIKPNN